MAKPRPFRFGANGLRTGSRQELVAYARRVEDLGYATLVGGLHLSLGGRGLVAALSAAAAVTTSLRLGSHVFPLDFYRLVTLAQEAATHDLLSDGRLEFGLGAGWLPTDYEAAGVPFDPPGVRVGRLAEAVRLAKQLFTGEAVTFAGDHYRVDGLTLSPRPAQRPHPPLFLGGGARRTLSLAAREADIVGLDLAATAAGTFDLASMTAAAMSQKVDWVRQAAGERFDALELHVLIDVMTVTDDRRRGAEEVARTIASLPPTMVSDPGLSPDQLLESPHVLVGSVGQIAETLQARRERFGISYVTVQNAFLEDFAPVVAHLAGT